MSFNNRTFHAYLQARMAQDGLSIRVAAQQSGLSAATMSRMMHGKAPDLETFAIIAAWLGTDTCVFFDHPVSVLDDEATTWIMLHIALDTLGMPQDFIESLERMIRIIQAKKEEQQPV